MLLSSCMGKRVQTDNYTVLLLFCPDTLVAQSYVLSVSLSGILIRPRSHYSLSFLMLSSAASVCIVMSSLISGYYALLHGVD